MLTPERIKKAYPHLTPEAAADMAAIANKRGMTMAQLRLTIKAGKKLQRAIARAGETAVKFGKALDAFAHTLTLRAVATKKEWHLMHHAKRRRTRKKYERRLERRAALIRKGEHE